VIHKTTTGLPQNGHAALGGRQQPRSNIKGRAAPPLFLRREPSGKGSTSWSKPCPGRLGVAGQGIFYAESAEAISPSPQARRPEHHKTYQQARSAMRGMVCPMRHFREKAACSPSKRPRLRGTSAMGADGMLDNTDKAERYWALIIEASAEPQR
jgi:hypothetical protein